MIKIINGIYGMPKGKMVVPVTAEDGPIEIDPKREQELVEQGVAEYVNAPAAEEDVQLDKMNVRQLKEIADQMGIEYPGNIKKDDLIQLIETAEEEPEEENDEEEAPELDPMQAVQ